MGLYLFSLNTATSLDIVNIGLAFAFGQLWWGLTQPFTGAVADRIDPQSDLRHRHIGCGMP